VDQRRELIPGDLIATVRFADRRWFSGDWTNALLIYEQCLVYSGGRSRDYRTRSRRARRGPSRADASGRSRSARWFDERVASDAGPGPIELVATHRDNWMVWSTDVRSWKVRRGIAVSRLRLELADGTRRRILWGHASNSLTTIAAALHQALGAPA
jgi:hypothetical protein